MTDSENTTPEPVDHHAAEQLFAHGQYEGWEPIGEPELLVDAGAEAGVTIAATATSNGTVAIATVVTQNDAGESIEPTKTTIQLDPAGLIRLAGLVPPEYLSPHAGGAEIIQLHPGPVMNDVIVEQNGVTNAPCQAGGCERRIQQDPTTGEWDHLPDALGLKPAHAAIPPAVLQGDDTEPEPDPDAPPATPRPAPLVTREADSSEA